MRIVSLVPSLTELVWWLGRDDWLIGRTRFCTEPEGLIERVPAFGGTKDPDVVAIAGLRPDLVITNREENRKEDVEALEAAGLRVVLTDPNSVDEAVAMVAELGALLGGDERAQELVADIDAALAAPVPGPKVFVAVWKKPLLGLGSESYGNDLIRRCGATNVLAGRPRYPETSQEELIALAPDLILLPDEPYRFRERDRKEFSRIAPARLVDGKALWWYGPRMPEAIRQLRALFTAPTG
ncbi:MAG: helical backbone metal receptor [Dehalococcoidia bacterium]|nr:ABC transporter substrate-binding protein [Dehalococcoidia bacterium]MCB9485925.1 ABC transporter substrate-binding protein [Thermoflexaceae bacterium]